mgnify:CR=1 FL=1
MDNILNEINKLYNKTGYTDIHGLDLWTSIILVESLNLLKSSLIELTILFNATKIIFIAFIK